MDPIAHTLVGAAMAEAGLKKLSRYATATLLIGVNLPDIDGIASFWGNDTALYIRRGWSHGVLALIILPLLLAGAVWLWHRWRGQRKSHAPPLRMGMIVALSFLAVWSHPLLDWMNTYGVRLLMPFDDRWFYGDTLFIVDPWVWLLAAAGVVLARSASAPAIAGWSILAATATAVILLSELAPLSVKILWVLGVTVIVCLRWRKPSPAFRAAIAQASFASLVLYICVAYGLARMAESAVANDSSGPLEVQANPQPGRPGAHRLVMVFEDYYRVVQVDGEVIEVPRVAPSDIVQAALEAESIRGFVTWMRFPYWEIEETDSHWVVTIRDLRYVDPDARESGIGIAQVTLSKETMKEER